MKVKENETLFKALFNTINDPIIIHPLLEKGFEPFVLVNKAACDLYGFSEEEFLKLKVSDITNHKVTEVEIDKLRKFKKHRFEVIHKTKSGKEIPVDINTTIIEVNEKKLILSVVRDVTDKKEKEKELIVAINKAKETSRMLENVINTIPSRIFWKDIDLNYLGCNKLFANDGGVDNPNELIGKCDYDMIWKEEADLYRSDDRLVIESKESKINYEELQTNSEGEKSWLRTSKIPLVNKDGVVTGVLGAYNDITPKKNQELELEKTQKKLLNAQKIAQLGSWTFEVKDKKFKFSNELYNLFGISKKEINIPYERWEELVHPEDREEAIEKINSVINTKKKFEINSRIIRFDNRETRWFNIRGQYFKDKNDVVVIQGIAQDVTALTNIKLELEEHKNNLEKLVKGQTKELKASNEELLVINNEIMQKNKIINENNLQLKKTLNKLKDTQTQLMHADKMASLGILTAGISHELNNPLNFIQGGLMGLKTVLGEEQNKPEVNELLEIINIGIQRASGIITGLNNFNRSNDDYNELCDIHSIIDNTLVMLNNELKHKVELKKQYDVSKIEIKGNVGKLHQVFLNIIANSSYAIEKKGTIFITTEVKNNNVIIVITDSGFGIDKESIKHVFDPFYTTKEPGKGIGLGLSITHTIIKDHKGTIEFKSEKNKGTTVIIKLPI